MLSKYSAITFRTTSVRPASCASISVDKSLEELGKIAEPQITKDAIAGRIRRLLQLAEKTEKARAAEGK